MDASLPIPLPSPWPHCRLWRIALDAEAPHDEDLRLLSVGEQARAQRFAFARDRVRYVRAHAALRRLLAQALGAEPAALRLAEREGGKPWLPAAPGMRFNLSHSGGTAAVAISTEAEVGVDVEHTRPLPDAMALAAAHASPAERLALYVLPAPRREAAFLHLWTRKEACLKALGTGFAVDARLLDVGLGGLPRSRWLGTTAARPGGDLALASWQLPDGLHLALAAQHAAEHATERAMSAAPASRAAATTRPTPRPRARECAA